MTPLQILKEARAIMQANARATLSRALPEACEQNGVLLAPNGYGRAYIDLKKAMWGDSYRLGTVGSYEHQHGRQAAMEALDVAIARLER